MPDPRPPVRYSVDVADVTKMDPILAHLLCWISYYAYYDSAPAWYGDILGSHPLWKMPADEATGRPQGFILSVDEIDVVVFAGLTDYSTLWGLLRDVTYKTPPNGGPTLAAGYPWVRHTEAILSQYRTLLTTRMSLKKTIFTGHSMGGAIAALLCYAMQNDGSPGLQPSNAVSFGSPRLGNNNLAVATQNQFNVVLPGDMVPKLPPKGYTRPVLTSDATFQRSVWPTDGFTKHGRLTYLEENGGLSVLDPGVSTRPEDTGVEWDAARVFGEAFLSGVSFKNPARLAAESFGDSLERHYCSEYLRRLEKNIPNVADADGESLIKEAVFVEEKLAPAPPPLSTIDPPAYPTPAATTAARPLLLRRRH